MFVKIWTEISRVRLAGNFAALRRVLAAVDNKKSGLPATELLAVVKANAYGHGIDPCAAVLAKAGAEWLGVTDTVEGAEVRRVLAIAGIPEAEQPKVLVMCGTAGLPGEAEGVLRHRLTPVVWSLNHLERLAEAVRPAGPGAVVDVHLEIDSGMSRQGVRSGEDLTAILDAISKEPGLKLGGVFTHFASTEVFHSTQTAVQQAEFEAAIAQIAAAGMKSEWVHVGNSSYIDNGHEGSKSLIWLRKVAARLEARAMVRSGLGLYGYFLPLEGRDESLAAGQVLPVMTWKTRVIGISEIPADAAVGYSATFVTKRPMRLALLAAGYADGLRRELSSTNAEPGGWAMIHGQRAAIIGRVSMNLVSVDVSEIEDVGEGDEAVLLGEGVTADDHARLAGTIAYEILCGVRTSASPAFAHIRSGR